MARMTLSRGMLLVVLLLESLYLLVALHRIAALEDNCDDTTADEDDEYKYEMDQKEDTKTGPTIYILTATYRRTTQIADLTRLSQTLMHVPALHWIVIEDAELRSEAVGQLLMRTGLPFTHLSATTPKEYLEHKMMGRGVFNRREGLRWLREHTTEGVLYVADDDNTYDVRIFEQMRGTRRVTVFPVGMILQYGLSSPVVRDGRVVAFHDAFQAGRKFAMDFAGFAVNLRLLHINPGATIPTRVSYLEDGFLRQLKVELDDLEPLAWGCTEVLVWHTRTQRPATPKMSRISKDDLNTNLVTLYHNTLR